MAEPEHLSVIIDEVASYVRNGKHKDAKILIKRALELSPRSATLWEALGRTLNSLGDKSNAIEALKQAHILRQRIDNPLVSVEEQIDDTDLQYLSEIDAQHRSVSNYVFDEEKTSIPQILDQHRQKGDTHLYNKLIDPADHIPAPPEIQQEDITVDPASDAEIEGEIWTCEDDLFDSELESLDIHYGDKEVIFSVPPEIDGFRGEDDPDEDLFPDFLFQAETLAIDIEESELYSIDPDMFVDESLPSLNGSNISIEQRARQLAIQFVYDFDWAEGAIDILTTVFSSRRWGATYKVLAVYAEEGMTEEELILAYQLRELWAESMQYWIVFYSNGDSDSRFKQFSWAQCLRFLNLFTKCGSIPCKEEIFELIDDLYQSWYSTRSLRITHRAFALFLDDWLKLHADSTYPLDVLRNFNEQKEYLQEIWFDTGHYDLLQIVQLKQLEGYGFSYGNYGLSRLIHKYEGVGESVYYDITVS